MNRILLSITTLLLSFSNLISQNWMWIKGDSVSFANSHYGIQGQPNITNTPGSKWQAAHTIGNNNNLWMFGGFRKDLDPFYSAFNDLWKFDTQTNSWTWVKGDTIPGKKSNYGNKSVSNINNKPGGRAGSALLTDNLGNLWLFGGFGSGTIAGALNDLWKFNISTNEWTWISGDSITGQLSKYGTKGVASATNCPGGRRFMAHWVDNSNDLWFFGGEGFANSGTASDALNDVWKYNISTNQWTWISGDSITAQTGNYGQMGVASILFKPCSRSGSSYWKDNSGNFWIFGGLGTTNNSGVLNDLWKFEPSNNKWTWVKGSNLVDQPGSYGNLGISSIQNVPSGRWACSSGIDASNNLLLFGGAVLGHYHNNDLWRYNIPSNQWTWIKGDSSSLTPNYNSGFYGQQNVTTSTNKVGARMFSSFWIDNQNSIFLFGGGRRNNNIGEIQNDLWSFKLPEYAGIMEATNENINFKIYPNPTTDHLTIETINSQNNYSLSIYDAKGTIVFKEETSKNFFNISLKQFDKGIYNVIVITNNDIICKKIIKN